MTTYTLKLTPTLRNMSTEGSLDTALVDGVSIQRTGYIEVPTGEDHERKIVEVDDGEEFDDSPMDPLTGQPGVTIV